MRHKLLANFTVLHGWTAFITWFQVVFSGLEIEHKMALDRNGQDWRSRTSLLLSETFEHFVWIQLAGASGSLYIYFIRLGMEPKAGFICHCCHFDKELIESAVTQELLWKTGESLFRHGLWAFLMFPSLSGQNWASACVPM